MQSTLLRYQSKVFALIVSVLLVTLLLSPMASRSADFTAGRMADETRAAISRTIRTILVESLPAQVDDEEDWGAKREVPSGLNFERSNGRLRLDKRTKEVNHGLWRRITVTPVEPDKNLRFEIIEARTIGPQKVAYELLAAAPVRGTARVERWRLGVKMLNFTTVADATIEMRLHGELTYQVDWQGNISQVTVVPTVRTVDLKLVEFDLQRLGILDGKLAEELGDVATKPLGKQLDKQEPRVVEKINQALAARQNQFALKVDWTRFAENLAHWLQPHSDLSP